jgi:hypothetical protein
MGAGAVNEEGKTRKGRGEPKELSAGCSFVFVYERD